MTREPVDLLRPQCGRESDGKGFRRTLGVCRNPFLLVSSLKKKENTMKQLKKAVIAYRKTCPAKGTGLSHYILMDKKAK
jgi:modified peptide precursor CbpA